MAFSRARDFDILDSEFIDVAGNYNHQTTTSMSQVIGGSASNSREINEPNSVGLSQSSNVAGNQINNVITYITIIPGPSTPGKVTPSPIPSACITPSSSTSHVEYERALTGSHQHVPGPAPLIRPNLNGITHFGGPDKSKIVAIALFDYHANEDNDLNLVEGERIEQIDKLGQDSEWWVGLGSGGQCGFFPANHVKIIKDPDDGITGITAIALYDYDANEDDDLSLVEGDLIEHIVKLSDPWWAGFGPGGKRGFFPANRVQLIGHSDDYMPGIAAIALHDYDAGEDNEISFVEGDQIKHIDKLNNDEWWAGVGPGPKWGLFPANHVKLIK